MATPIAYLGWEQGLSEANVIVAHNNSYTTSAPDTTKARTGSRSLRISSGPPMRGKLVNNLTELRAFCAINHNGATGSGGSLTACPALFGLSVVNPSGDRIAFYWNPVDGIFRIVRLQSNGTATSIAVAPAPVFSTPDVWHELSIAVKIHAAVGFYRIYLNGAEVVGFDGDTTLGGLVDTIYAVLFAGSTNASGQWNQYAYVDDCYIEDSTGEAAQPCRSRKIYFASVNGNGQLSELAGSDGNSTDNYLLVDEVDTADGDTTYVGAVAANLDDLYTHPAITLDAGYVPVRYAINATVRKTDPTVASTISLAAWKAAQHDAGAARDLSTAYTSYQEIFAALPDDSAMNIANLNAMEIGVRSAGVYS